MSKYVGAIDQGTTSTRFILFDRQGEIVSLDQKEHEQITPRPGWVEHDPAEIWRNTQTVIQRRPGEEGTEPRRSRQRRRHQPARDDRHLESPHRRGAAQCAGLDGHAHRRPRRANSPRTAARIACAPRPACRWRPIFPASNCAGCSIMCPARRKAPQSGDVLFGTIDSWIAWNLTGGVRSGRHITDVTNASRTQLMNLETLDWDQDILNLFDIPRACLPEIRSSSEDMGLATGVLAGVPLAGILGDQQAALFGQACLLARTGEKHLRHGLLPAHEHGRKAVSVDMRADHNGRLQAGRRAARLCAGRLDRHHRRAGAMAARQSRPDLRGVGDRGRWREPSPTMAASFSFPPFPDFMRRIGAPMRAALSRA